MGRKRGIVRKSKVRKRSKSSSAKIKRVCFGCGDVFCVFKSSVISRASNFCSRKCYDSKRSSIVNRVCRNCGIVFMFQASPSRIIGNRGNTCSKRCFYQYKSTIPHNGFGMETRRRMSIAQKKLVADGRCMLWRGGLTDKNKAFRMTSEYKIWRESVFKRDGYRCVFCGDSSGNGHTVVLNADHIKPFYKYPELRLNLSNGRTLCRDCHKKTDTWGRPRNEEKYKKEEVQITVGSR